MTLQLREIILDFRGPWPFDTVILSPTPFAR